MAKKKGKKLRFKGLILIFLLFYLIGMCIYYLFTLPVKNVLVSGNVYIEESEIINALNLSSHPPLYKINKNTLRKNLDKYDLIKEVKIKKSFLGNLTIEITEYKPLYYNVLTKKVALSNNSEIEADYILGLPTLVNYIPSKENEQFVSNFALVDEDIIKMISEIEYDNDRYILRMNDNNIVYVNVYTLEKLNKYISIYSNFGSGKIIDLDSVDTSSNKYIIRDQ